MLISHFEPYSNINQLVISQKPNTLEIWRETLFSPYPLASDKFLGRKKEKKKDSALFLGTLEIRWHAPKYYILAKHNKDLSDSFFFDEWRLCFMKIYILIPRFSPPNLFFSTE
jgi:hypothetical protein